MRFFWFVALIFGFSFSINPMSTAQVLLNASGSDGKDGQDGRDGVGYGDHGTDATPSTPGEHAGKIHVTLIPKSKKTFQILGQISGINPIHLDSTLTYAPHLSLTFMAKGGRGGSGGRGGNGIVGKPGEKGQDATRSSDGTQGGPGGNGGNGGKGTPGSRGGNGGHIRVAVRASDTHLLMWVGPVNTSGGIGGNNGENGAGGEGGPGGRGGNAYTWTTHVSTGKITIRRKHQRPGGLDGPIGHSGSPGSGDIHGGEPGVKGSFSYVVDGKEYASRYDIQVVHFDIDDENQDGIFEPGEQIFIKNIQIKNVGGMPTPIAAPVLIFLHKGPWIIAPTRPLAFHQSLRPGEEAYLQGTLQFRITDDPTVREGAPLLRNHQVTAHAKMGIVEKVFDGAEKTQSLSVNHPLELMSFKVPENIAPGQTRPVTWIIKNNSKKEYGSASDLKRVIASTLSLCKSKTTCPPHFIEILDDKGAHIDLEKGKNHLISKIGPGESVEIRASLRLSPDAEVYQKIGVQTNLAIGDKRYPKKPVSTQIQRVTLNVSYLYRKSERSDFVLVTNHDTTRDEILTWQQLLQSLNLRADVWDLSYEGHLDLQKDYEQGKKLYQDLKNKTLILLNNTISTNGFRYEPLGLARKNQIIDAALIQKSNVYVVGGKFEQIKSIFNLYTLPSEFRGPKTLLTTDGLISKIRKADVRPGFVPKTQYWGTIHAIETVWLDVNAPSPETHLRRIAHEINAQLSAEFPERKFYFVYNPSYRVVDDGIFRNTISHGEMDIYETLETFTGNLSALAERASAFDLHSEHFIRGTSNLLGVLNALSFKKKLQIFNAISNHETSYPEELSPRVIWALQHAVISDLMSEIHALIKKPESSQGIRLDKKERYPVFNQFAQFFTKNKFNFKDKRDQSYGVTLAVSQILSTVYHVCSQIYKEGLGQILLRTEDNLAAQQIAKTLTAESLELLNVLDPGIGGLIKNQWETRANRVLAKETLQARYGLLERYITPVAGYLRSPVIHMTSDERIFSKDQFIRLNKSMLQLEDAAQELIEKLNREPRGQ